MSRRRSTIKPLNIRYPWTDALERANKPVPGPPGKISDREAWQRVRPRTRQDKLFFVRTALLLIACVAIVVFLSHIIHLNPQTKTQLRQSTAPASIQ